MTLSIVMIMTALFAAAFTILSKFVFKNAISPLMSYLQYFTGGLFLFSGWVKAVDPLGTAYKMEQYFDEFTYTFEPTWFGFLTPMFEYFSQISISFSLFMIIFEIILGLMLILGVKPKLSAWLFFLLVAFFTFLTGFTYLTGYVQEGGNFFDFSTWGAYKKSNMKVTDCGCFGDFIVLEPKISFFKDLVLLVPAIYFLFFHKDMHQFFTAKVRNILLAISTIGLLVYCMSNYVWNLPGQDYRPFKIGTDVAKIKEAEDDAAANVQITAWELENTTTGESITLPTDEYFAKLAEYNKANGWSVKEQISTEPTIKATKISAFEITDFDQNDVSYEYLDSEDYNFMIVSHKMAYKSNKKSRIVQDTIFAVDTLQTPTADSIVIVKSLDKIVDTTEDYYEVVWDEAFIDDYIKVIRPLAEEAAKAGAKISIVTGGAEKSVLEDFAVKTGIKADFYTADDILLKTIVRSNPGVVLWKDGKIIYKWHKNKLPSFTEIQSNYMK